MGPSCYLFLWKVLGLPPAPRHPCPPGEEAGLSHARLGTVSLLWFWGPLELSCEGSRKQDASLLYTHMGCLAEAILGVFRHLSWLKWTLIRVGKSRFLQCRVKPVAE